MRPLLLNLAFKGERTINLLQCEDCLGRGKAKEGGSKCIFVQTVFEEIDCGYISCSMLFSLASVVLNFAI